MTDVDKFQHARENAKGWLESIREMVTRLEHAESDCMGHGNDDPNDDCELSTDDMGGLESADYHDADAARQAIEESVLNVELTGKWTPGSEPVATGYEILLTTGGPALRIVGALGDYSMPVTAQLEMQDWGTQWEHYSGDPAILTFASVFYFGD